MLDRSPRNPCSRATGAAERFPRETIPTLPWRPSWKAAFTACAGHRRRQRSMSRCPVRGTGHEAGRSRPGRADHRPKADGHSVPRPKACDEPPAFARHRLAVDGCSSCWLLAVEGGSRARPWPRRSEPLTHLEWPHACGQRMLGAFPAQHPCHAASAGFGAAPRFVHLVSVSRGKRRKRQRAAKAFRP
jgi:hypothetical protein